MGVLFLIFIQYSIKMIPVFLLTAMIVFLLLTISIATTKTILFIKNIGDKKLAWWFFFPRYIVIPSSKTGRKAKELQNKLSAILFFMLLIEMGLWFILKVFY